MLIEQKNTFANNILCVHVFKLKISLVGNYVNIVNIIKNKGDQIC
jgi:hypothetical protein